MHRKPGAGSLLQPTTRPAVASTAASIGKRTLVSQAYRAPTAHPPAPAPPLRDAPAPRRPSPTSADLDDAFPPARHRFAPPSRPSTSVSTSTSLLHRVFGRLRGVSPEELEPQPAPAGDSAADV